MEDSGEVGDSDSRMKASGEPGRYGEDLPPPWFINKGILLHAGNAPRSPWITGVGGLGACRGLSQHIWWLPDWDSQVNLYSRLHRSHYLCSSASFSILISM